MKKEEQTLNLNIAGLPERRRPGRVATALFRTVVIVPPCLFLGCLLAALGAAYPLFGAFLGSIWFIVLAGCCSLAFWAFAAISVFHEHKNHIHETAAVSVVLYGLQLLLWLTAFLCLEAFTLPRFLSNAFSLLPPVLLLLGASTFLSAAGLKSGSARRMEIASLLQFLMFFLVWVAVIPS